MHHIGVTSVAPLAIASLRQHYYVLLVGVDHELAHWAVARVGSTVGVTYVEIVFASLIHFHRDGYHAITVGAKLHHLSRISHDVGARVGIIGKGETLIMLSRQHYVRLRDEALRIFVLSHYIYNVERLRESWQHERRVSAIECAVVDDDRIGVAAAIIRYAGAVAVPNHVWRERASVGFAHIDGLFRAAARGKSNLDGVRSADVVADEIAVMRLFVEFNRCYFRSGAFDGDVKRGISVAKTIDVLSAGHASRHKRVKLYAMRLEFDASHSSEHHRHIGASV